MKNSIPGLLAALLALFIALPANSADIPRHRVIVSTDIGGTDPDDFQSMVHLLLYADSLDIEGLISSPSGPGRKQHILDVIDLYESDYETLRGYSDDYPAPDKLRSVTRQGEVEVAPFRGFRQPTEGSKWIIERARADDSRPLHILVWGGIEDLAQALHDAPDILPRLRVYWIGGPNKKWSPDAYQFIVTHHPELQIIESNATYRGWFVGGNQEGEWGNQGFVKSHVAGHGALGDFFATQLGGTIKMGDTPSVGWLLNGTPADPSQPGWGGQFVRAWTRPHKVFERLTTLDDEIEEFGIFELVLPLGVDAPDQPKAQMLIENQALNGFVDADGNVRFRFCPKGAKKFSYTIRSNAPSLDGKAGELTAMPTSPDVALEPDENWPNWWTDDPRPEFAEGPHIGAKSVSRWREDYLSDFSERMSRARKTVAVPGNFDASILDINPDWYASGEARDAADNVLLYQSSVGAWPKNTDLLAPATARDIETLGSGGKANTIDNDATTLPMRFIALVAKATGDARYKDSFSRGLDYLFAAQYENGGWPQFYPLREGYFSRITYNDNAMMNVMSLLRDVAAGTEPFTFVDDDRRAKAARAIERGLDCILKTQLRQNGKLTAWAAQYDEETLTPAWARAYEPPSLSGNETVAIVRYLMEIEHPTADQVAAIEGAVAWLNAVAIRGYRFHRGPNAEGVRDATIIPDPTAGPLWARFYELDTNRPLFLGRDSVYRYSLAEIELERRDGYAYYGTWPQELLSRDYRQWQARNKAVTSCFDVATPGVTRIMPLGDSITYDNRRKDMRPTGVRIAYRRALHDLLISAGYAFNFVGSEDGGDRYLGAEMDDNAGFPGITDDQLAVLISTGFAGHTSRQVTPGPYLEACPADIILLHIGTNHVEATPADVQQILDDIRSSDPGVYIIVARIINRYPYDEVTTTFNDNVEAMVTARADSRIIMVDMEDGAGIDYYTDMDDDLHPNHLGYNKMAAVWFEALSELLSSPDYKQ